MSVYVDDTFEAVPRTSQARRCGNKWCHMFADTNEELESMARRVGMKPQWIQNVGMGRHREHYDLVPSRRAAAVKAGAIEIDKQGYKEFLRRHASAGLFNVLYGEQP